MTGEAAPILVDLVGRGIIRVLDVVFLTKGEDGSVAGFAIDGIEPDRIGDFAVFEGRPRGCSATTTRNRPTTQRERSHAEALEGDGPHRGRRGDRNGGLEQRQRLMSALARLSSTRDERGAGGSCYGDGGGASSDATRRSSSAGHSCPQ